MKLGKASRYMLGVAVLAGVVAAFAHRDALGEGGIFERLAHAGAWAPVAFIALYAAATVMFLPGSVLTLVAGVIFGPVPGALYSLVGATLGATLAFLVARYLAGDLVSRKVGGRLGQLMDGVDAEGWRFVAFVRLVPLFPFNLVNYALGLTRIRLGQYVIASAVCMLPGALAYAWLGHAGRDAYEGADSAVRNGMLALALVAAIAFLPRIVRRLKAADSISPQRLRTLLDEGAIRLIDVRGAAEFHGDDGFIRGARNIPLEDLPLHVEELAPCRGGGLVLICRTHVRSGKAARLLASQGFTQVCLVHGGMTAWKKLGFPTESFQAVPESTVHPQEITA